MHTAETVKSKLTAIDGLEQRVKDKQLENAVRNYIATNPWLISPQWETFAVEKRLTTICDGASKEALIDEEFKGRVDLVLSSGKQLLLLEFMRPGLKINRDHIDRFNQYLDIIQENIDVSTGLGFDHNQITGYLVADELLKPAGMATAIKAMKEKDRYAMSWDDLIAQAKHQWKEFLEHIKQRAPDDTRVQNV